MNRVPAIGERFELAEEGIFGVVTDVINDRDDDPAAIVVQMDNGGWASVDLSAIEWIPATVH